MGIKSRIIQHGAILVLLLMVPPAIATESPPCLAYAYTVESENGHYSLIKNNTFVFGTQIIVVSNCDSTQIIIDENLVAFGNNTINAYTSPGTYDVKIKNSGFESQYQNVTFIQGGALTNAISKLPAGDNPYSMPYTIDEINSIELWSGIGAILVSWFIVTTFLWKIIKSHNDKNYCMEVG